MDTQIFDDGQGSNPGRQSWREYWLVVVQHRWLVALVCLLTLTATGIYLWKAPRVYEAAARIEVPIGNQHVLDMRNIDADTARLSPDVLLKRHVQMIKDPGLVQSAMAAAMPRTREDIQTKQPRGNQADPKVRSPNGAGVSDWLWERLQAGFYSYVDPAFDRITEALAMSHPRIAPSIVNEAGMIDVRVRYSDPHVVANLANELATGYVATNLNQRSAFYSSVGEDLLQEANEIHAKWQMKEKAVRDFEKAHENFYFGEGETAFAEELQALQLSLDKTESEQRRVRKLLNKPGRVTELERVGVLNLEEGHSLERIVSQIRQTQEQLTELRTRYKEKHPKMQRIEKRLTVFQGLLDEGLAAYLQELEGDEAEIKGQISAIQSRREEFRDLATEYRRLKNEAEQQEALYKRVQNRIKEAELLSRVRSHPGRVLERAEVPSAPVSPNFAMVGLAGLMVGGVVGLGLAFLVHFVDEKVRTVRDVEADLGHRFLGYVPKVYKKRKQQVALTSSDSPESVAAECFRQIRTLLRVNKSNQVIGVTSVMANEGKSVVSSNLAIVMAQAGWKTLLIDGDPVRRSLAPIFSKGAKTPEKGGGGNTRFEDKVTHTEIEGLDVISLPPRNGARAIYEDEAVNRFLAKAREKYQQVVIDCPPVSVVSGALVIGEHCDGMLIVSRFNQTSKEKLRMWLARLANAKISVSGIIVNVIDCEKRDRHFARWNFDQYYDYQSYRK